MRHGSLFSGIGGFDLSSEWMGWENVFHCEWMEFPRKVLEYYWPAADSHIDICKTDFKKYANTIDILTGGFPCQPFSLAGKRKGTDDERYLWGEMLRAIQEIKPTWVIAENVFGITNIDSGLVFEQVCIDLENEGYEVQPFVIPAAAKNAPHRRDRCWFIATNTKRIRLEHSKEAGNIREGKTKTQRERSKFTKPFETNGINGNATDTDSTSAQCRNCEATKGWKDQGRRIEPFGFDMEWKKFPTQPPICGGDDGLPTKLDGITFSKWRNESIKGYGNAIVPQIAYQLFQIIEHETKNKTTQKTKQQDIIPDFGN
jgi:DNA (cytosine-5)-methyltransferase 1